MFMPSTRRATIVARAQARVDPPSLAAFLELGKPQDGRNGYEGKATRNGRGVKPSLSDTAEGGVPCRKLLPALFPGCGAHTVAHPWRFSGAGAKPNTSDFCFLGAEPTR